jgi:sorbitol-specific phosphotransferase system component IIC
MQNNSKLAERSLEVVYPLFLSILESNNKAIPQLYEVLKVESHPMTKVLGRGNPGDLYILCVIVLGLMSLGKEI